MGSGKLGEGVRVCVCVWGARGCSGLALTCDQPEGERGRLGCGGGLRRGRECGTGGRRGNRVRRPRKAQRVAIGEALNMHCQGLFIYFYYRLDRRIRRLLGLQFVSARAWDRDCESETESVIVVEAGGASARVATVTAAATAATATGTAKASRARATAVTATDQSGRPALFEAGGMVAAPREGGSEKRSATDKILSK
jgi:hypothetical protein